MRQNIFVSIINFALDIWLCPHTVRNSYKKICTFAAMFPAKIPGYISAILLCSLYSAASKSVIYQPRICKITNFLALYRLNICTLTDFLVLYRLILWDCANISVH